MIFQNASGSGKFAILSLFEHIDMSFQVQGERGFGNFDLLLFAAVRVLT